MRRTIRNMLADGEQLKLLNTQTIMNQLHLESPNRWTSQDSLWTWSLRLINDNKSESHLKTSETFMVIMLLSSQVGVVCNDIPDIALCKRLLHCCTVSSCVDNSACLTSGSQTIVNPANVVSLHSKCVTTTGTACSAAMTYQWTIYQKAAGNTWLPISNCADFATGRFVRHGASFIKWQNCSAVMLWAGIAVC